MSMSIKSPMEIFTCKKIKAPHDSVYLSDLRCMYTSIKFCFWWNLETNLFCVDFYSSLFFPFCFCRFGELWIQRSNSLLYCVDLNLLQGQAQIRTKAFTHCEFLQRGRTRCILRGCRGRKWVLVLIVRGAIPFRYTWPEFDRPRAEEQPSYLTLFCITQKRETVITLDLTLQDPEERTDLFKTKTKIARMVKRKMKRLLRRYPLQPYVEMPQTDAWKGSGNVIDTCWCLPPGFQPCS